MWNHIQVALKNSKENLEIRLALLLHDIGKPHSCQEDENGVRHFKGHDKKSAEIAEIVLKRIGYEENKRKEIVFLIENHATTIDIEKINKNNLEFYKKLIYIQYCDALAYAPEYVPKVTEKLDIILEKMQERIKRIEDTDKGER